MSLATDRMAQQVDIQGEVRQSGSPPSVVKTFSRWAFATDLLFPPQSPASGVFENTMVNNAQTSRSDQKDDGTKNRIPKENLPMRKLLLIATLSLGTFALAQPMAGNMGDAQSADHDSYNKTVAAQAKHNSLSLAANAVSASPPAQLESFSGTQLGSMAANAGSQSAGDDFYNQTIAAQANENGLFEAANRI